MNFKFIRRKQEFKYCGYRKEILPIIEKAMAEYILRISINSSYVILGIYDIASESFYKHSIADFLDQIPSNLSYPLQFSPYLKPYTSGKFRNIVYSDHHELIIGSFYGYYFARLPILILHGRYIDWPQCRGVSEDDLEKIMSYSFSYFETYLPTVAKKLKGTSSDLYHIISDYLDGKDMAYKYKLKEEKMKEFIYNNDMIWADIVECLPKMKIDSNGRKESWNIFSVFEKAFNSYFERFWDSYRSDYMDTLRHWDIAGAFEGSESTLSPWMGFWKDLETRIDRHEFILRTSESY